MNHKFLLHNILSILLIFNVAVSGIASDVNTDSLKQVLQSTSIDSIKADALYQLATELEKTDKKQALDYYNEALEFEKNESKRASIYNSIGMYHLQRGDNSKSLNFFEKAVELLEELNDSSMLGRVYNNSAVANYWLGNSNEALTLYLGALDIRKSLNDTLGVVKVSNNIGLIYQDWELYNQAIEWHQEALLVAKDANAYHDLSYTYANIGKCHENLDDYKAALRNYRLGHENAIKADSRNEINSYLSGFYGSIYRRMNMPDSALFHFQKSLDYSHRINNTNRTAIAEYELGKTYFDLNQKDSAQKYITQSYTLSAKNYYPDLLKNNLFILAELAEEEGDTENAYRYLKEATQLKDSLFNAEKISKFTNLQVKYFNQQQQQENIILKQNNELQEIAIREQKLKSWIYLGSGIIFLVALIFITRSRMKLIKLSSKLEKSEKQLMKANADKDKFFTIIAHDLKSPFNGLLGLTTIITEEFDKLPPPKMKELMLELKNSAANVYALVEGLLSWSQVQTGKISYEKEKTDLSEISKKVKEQFITSAKNKDITLDQQIEKNTFVIADEKSISTVLRNLVCNAIKYTNTGGKITVSARQKNNHVEISVSDNGIGMEKAKMEKLFSISEKISEPGTASEKGTGLGLILCKEFVEKNNGKIWAESEPGKGSRFIFTLPAAE
ncbi:MAG: tetratricopeptide repeat protein [Tangfeifania sp.]